MDRKHRWISRRLIAQKLKPALQVQFFQPGIVAPGIQSDKFFTACSGLVFRPFYNFLHKIPSPERRIGHDAVQVNGRIKVFFAPNSGVGISREKNTSDLSIHHDLPLSALGDFVGYELSVKGQPMLVGYRLLMGNGRIVQVKNGL